MKRGMAALLLLLTLFTLGACSRRATAKPMRLKAAELTKQEQGIFDLMKEDRSAALYDFSLDAPATAVDVRAYELTADGKWSGGGGAVALNADKGRLYVSFRRISEGLSMAVQSDGGTVSTCSKAPESARDAQEVATVLEAAECDIAWEKEIPLALQVVAPAGQGVSLSVEYYDRPEELMNQGYLSLIHIFAPCDGR